MNHIIRKSELQDAPHFVRIKNALPLPATTNATKNGGFLLGTDIPTYQFYIEHGSCLTAEKDGKIIGFGIVLPNHIIRESELWKKRNSVNWAINIRLLEQSNIAYFEQLAFIQGRRKISMQLAYQVAKSAFDKGAEFILTTTVNKPIANKAAIPYITAIGGRKIGNIDETYPQVGAINSDIYLIAKNDFFNKLKKLPYYPILTSNEMAY